MLPTPTPSASASAGIGTSVPSRANSSSATASVRARLSSGLSSAHGRPMRAGMAIPLGYRGRGRNGRSAFHALETRLVTHTLSDRQNPNLTLAVLALSGMAYSLLQSL